MRERAIRCLQHSYTVHRVLHRLRKRSDICLHTVYDRQRRCVIFTRINSFSCRELRQRRSQACLCERQGIINAQYRDVIENGERHER